MAFIDQRQHGLILDWVTGHITRAELDRDFAGDDLEAISGAPSGLDILSASLLTRDAGDVECGLMVGIMSGISADYLGVLVVLVNASWHPWHEDVVDALGQLCSRKSAEVLYGVARAAHSHLHPMQAAMLRLRAIQALECIAHAAGGYVRDWRTCDGPLEHTAAALRTTSREWLAACSPYARGTGDAAV